MENKKILQVRSDILMHDLINENEINTIEEMSMKKASELISKIIKKGQNNE